MMALTLGNCNNLPFSDRGFGLGCFSLFALPLKCARSKAIARFNLLNGEKLRKCHIPQRPLGLGAPLFFRQGS